MKNHQPDSPGVPVETPGLPPGVWPKLKAMVETLQGLTVAELDAMGSSFRDMAAIIEVIAKFKREEQK